MKEKEKRSLYDCFQAKVKGDRIYCTKGHKFETSPDGSSAISRLVRGQPLEFTTCQDCPDFEQMDGGKVLKEDRGWMQQKNPWGKTKIPPARFDEIKVQSLIKVQNLKT